MPKPARKNTPTTPLTPVGEITLGVDTHLEFHVAAAQDSLGRLLGTLKFPATHAGFEQVWDWATAFGPLTLAGVEGTGSYGATLTRFLTEQGVDVVEVNRPNRVQRRLHGKSDAADAINAAGAAQSGRATAAPKPRGGPVETVRVLRITREQYLTARTAALNALHALLVTAPTQLRQALHGLPVRALLQRCRAFPAVELPDPRPGSRRRRQAATALAETLLDSGQGVRAALGELARQIDFYDQRLRELDDILHVLLRRIAPRTTALHGLGAETTGQLLVTVGDHPDRIHSEAAFATLTGVAPQDASSGKQEHHRLSRAGDRQANSALYHVVITRLATHDPSRTYMTERLRPGTRMTKKHLIRCLKRYLAREIYPRLMADLADMQALQTT
ncbi:IS110 family transposase [Crossiella sp. CA198]|uniref:IS110 family transposase n=1 Tax=Crossiella sp. CA198 TaxID=3455607 RepID=UPI003F8D358E